MADLATTSAEAVRSRRATEATLLIFAWVISMAAYANAGYGVTEEWPAGFTGYAITFAAYCVAAHLAVRQFARYADPVLLPTVMLLQGLGLALIYRLDLDEKEPSQRSFGPLAPRGDSGIQLIWAALGIALFVAVLVVIRDHRALQRYTYTAGGVGLVLLAIPALLPAQYSEVNGARIWIRLSLGKSDLSIQPGEFAKLLLIVFFAGYLVVKRDVLALASRRVAGLDLPRGRDLGPIIVAWLASLMILIAERDLGSSLLFFGVFVVLLYIATERTSWLVFGLTMFIAGAYFAYVSFGHVTRRVDIWLHPFDPDNVNDASYQLVQSLFGFSTGGILGTGLGQGRPSIVPYANTDFILATAGEELGLTGLMAILVLYAVIVHRALRTALAARDSFGKLLASGLAVIVALQVFVVVGGVTRLIPLTGLTTPFLSYGGSSLVANWALIALVLRVSDAARRPPPTQVATTEADTVVVKS
ncbi:MAG: FtsW/RodA/SpoVE family cell cycle protein [Sporichthyaceae bacterium]